MDGLWKQENTAGKVQLLEGKAQRHLAGKEWFVPMSWNDHSYVTEGRRNLEHNRVPKAGSEAVWLVLEEHGAQNQEPEFSAWHCF